MRRRIARNASPDRRRGRPSRRRPPRRGRPLWSTPGRGPRSSRIKMHLSSSEWGFGSGTIIHSTAEESIILTCAQVFRIKGRQQPQPEGLPRADLGRPLRRPDRQSPAGDDQLLGEGPPRRGDRLRFHQRCRPDPDQARPQAGRLESGPTLVETQAGHEDVHRGLLARQRRHRLGHDDPTRRSDEQHRDQAVVRRSKWSAGDVGSVAAPTGPTRPPGTRRSSTPASR